MAHNDVLEDASEPLLRQEPAPEHADATDAPTQTIRAAGEQTHTNPARPERHTPQPGTVLGQYELIRELGIGGMGSVYLARDTRLGRRVAVKLISHEDEPLAKRFLAEARATAACKHDNIVIIHDVGEASGYSYMVLEYIEGITLRAWLNDRWQPSLPPAPGLIHDLSPMPSLTPVATRVSPTLAVELMVPVLRALAHAHGQGLVHRDLKPENIMLAQSGAIKVLDFGIAKVLGHETASDTAPAGTGDGGAALKDRWTERGTLTRTGTVVGTLRYMSPEQWGADAVDSRTDLWAVGVMLWELVTGQHPLETLSRPRLRTVGQVSLPMSSLAELRPDLMPLAAIIDRCLRKPKAERIPSAQALLAELEPLFPGRSTPLLPGSGEPANPYAGLATFQEADAPRFFGRERDVASMMAQLASHPMVAVAGASGAGKSSFVRAGVIPALKRSGQRWESFILRPGREPLAALAGVLAQISQASTQAEPTERDALIETLRARPGHLGAVLRSRSQKQRTRILLFVDQFEELYTLGADRQTRQAFVHCLEGVADDASSPLRVVLSLRSDFLDRVAEDRAFTGEITRSLLLLPSLGRPELHEALVRPLEATGHSFESEELIASMLDTLEVTRSPLPLLQFTAAKLWEGRDRQTRCLTRASYDRLGGVAGALAAHADAVLAALSGPEQKLARLVFTSLVTEERTRAIVSLAELCAMAPALTASDGPAGPSNAVEHVVQHLAQARLLLIDTDGDRGGQILELSHESLIDRWPRLGQWLSEDEEAAAFRARLRLAAREWDKRGRSDDLLWRGQAAHEAARWLEHWLALGSGGEPMPGAAADIAELSPRDRDYLHAVVALAGRMRKRVRQVTAATIGCLGTIALLVSLLALRAGREATRADRESIQARNAGRMATAREHQFDPTLVLALVRELEPSHLPERWEDLARWALYQGIASAVLTHPDPLASAAFSPDGTRIVTASFDHIARVWNADGSGQPLILAGHSDYVRSAAFSPDGTRIVTASADNTARVWNADGSGQPLILSGHLDRVTSAVFSPNGTRIVTASFDKTVRVWNADGSGQPLILSGHLDRVYSAAFSPDGTRIVTASDDKTVRVWNADGSGQPLVLPGDPDRVSSAAFSPDGMRIVAACFDRTVRVWNADGSGQPLLLSGHLDAVSAAAFSPDGTRIVTASWDKTARVWNADGSGQPVLLSGHVDAIYAAAFSPDGSRIVTASFDKTARVWNADSAEESLLLSGHLGRVASAAFSPDSSRIVTASFDKTARVWNADGSGQPLLLSGHLDYVNSATFSPDGSRIVTASVDKTVRVWNADGSGQPLLLSGHLDFVNSAAFSPDSSRIVTASFDKTARVWNADGSGQPLILSGHLNYVHSAAFSPDSTRIVTASWDKTARVWNADGSGEPLILSGHLASVDTAVFSPDGKHILTVSDDKTIRIWNANGSGRPLIVRAPDLIASSVAFSPDGKHIVSTSHAGHTVRVWPKILPLSGPDDPALWRATTYCPPLELRRELLGVPAHIARRDLDNCQRRVEAARRLSLTEP